MGLCPQQRDEFFVVGRLLELCLLPWAARLSRDLGLSMTAQ
jgi:hypothetical protein